MWSARSALFRLLCGALARVFSWEGEVQKRSFLPGGEEKEEETRVRVRDFCRFCLSFFFGLSTSSKDTNRMANFYIIRSYGPTPSSSKRPTNPTIFSASLTSPASPRGSSSAGR